MIQTRLKLVSSERCCPRSSRCICPTQGKRWEGLPTANEKSPDRRGSSGDGRAGERAATAGRKLLQLDGGGGIAVDGHSKTKLKGQP